ncbi:phage tail tape measure protein [Rhodococcus opacus]|uniref:phage tail tape measure protein n=1 Tax=Rhodococcus opacus TaxID=37919 RepID=UPI001C441716|nr:phage tail tape measure protein [Rhodococcus opacus]MBV6758351.1 phage tail tape measure protein [Rhodococcus opacus]
MAVQVGELYAELRLDAEQFTRGLQEGEQGLGTLSDAARRAAQTAQASSDQQVQAYGRLRQAATQAGEAARNAHDRAATAAEQVRVAEQRLAQTRNAGDADAIAAAERRVEQARRDAARQAENAAQATDRMEASARRATRAAQDIDFTRLEREAQDAARATERIDLPAGLGERVRALGGSMGDLAGSVGSRAGGNSAGSFISGFSDRLGDLASSTGPIAGSLLGVAALGVAAGAALAAAIEDGLSAERDRDLFQAQTGVTEAQARKFGLAAGEAYSDVFGESVEANLSTLKLALQNNIIDPGATQRDAEAVVAQLDTITTALDGDMTTSVNAVSALMSTGLATSATEAADMIANAVGGSANKGDDLLEVIWEYSAGWKNAGLNAETALALIEQSTDSGAWNADVAGDAMREWGRRISEEGDDVKEALGGMGFEAEGMFERLSSGGEDSAAAFDELLDKVRSIEDPLERNNAIAALLGDTAGDFYDVFASWDPSEALKNFGEFEGAAGRLANTIGGNASTSVEGAMRSIETVGNNLKAALAEAFGPYIQEWANGIANNRAGVVQFFLDVGNGAFDGADAVLQFVSGGMRGLAEFADSGTDMAATFLRSLADMVGGLDMMGAVLSLVIPGASAVMGDLGGMADKLNAFAGTLEKGGDVTADALNKGADAIDQRLRPALDGAQERFNDFGMDVKTSAAFNDASAKMTNAINAVGVAADGSLMDLEKFTGGLAAGEQAPKALTDQVVGLKDALIDQVKTGAEAGATVEELTARYDEQRAALVSQLQAAGMSGEAAANYVKQLGLVPGLVETLFQQPGMPDAQYQLDVLNGKVLGIPGKREIHTTALTKDAIDDLTAVGLKVEELPDGTFRVLADTQAGEDALAEFLRRERHVTLGVTLAPNAAASLSAQGDAIAQQLSPGSTPDYSRVHFADGGVRVQSFADGGLPLTAPVGRLPDQAVIQSAQGKNGLIQWAEDETEGEVFIPLAKAKRRRSLQILAEAARRMGMRVVDEHADAAVSGARDHIASEFAKIFQGDPGSLDATSDPTGWRALLGGQYSDRTRRMFGIEEDNPLVSGILGARSMLVDGQFTDGMRAATGLEEDNPLIAAALGARSTVTTGNYDGSLRRFGAVEDGPLVGSLLGLNRMFFRRFADGGITEGAGSNPVDSLIALAKEHAPALQVTDDYRPGAADYHGAGQAVDFSNGSGNTDEQLAFANYLADNYKDQLAELIYIDPRFGRCIKDGEFVPDDFYAGAGDHTNHVHAAAKAALTAPKAGGSAKPDNRTEREKIADAIVAEGRRRNVSEKGIKAALAAGLAETDLQNLDYGEDGDNAGILQQRDNGAWGTLADRKDPTKAVGMFYDKLDDFDYESMDPADAAQKVQQSGTADGSNYRAKLAEADTLYAESDKRLAEMGTDSSSSSSSSTGSGQAVYVTNWPSNFGGSSTSSGSGSNSAPPAGSTSTDTAEKLEHDISTPAGRASLIQAIRGARFFANGGFGGVGAGEDHNAQIASAGSWRVFAEPETGGEAYIPLSPTKRNRSLAVWAQTGQRLGAFAAGAGLAAASGFDADGNFVGFKTNSSTIPGLEKLLEAASKPTVNIEHAEIKADDPQQLAENVVAEAGGDPMKLALMQLGL